MEACLTDSMIRLQHVSKTFPGTPSPAVEDLSFTVDRGEFVTLVGPSGCGKTTTLKMINRIIEPTSGEIWVDGVAATETPAYELRRSIGYVIQQIGLFPHRTIAQNIATVAELIGWDDERVQSRVNELVEVVGLDGSMLDRYPSELSGGQQQRVGVARALAADPPVLLMDEPFGAVDPIVRARLQDEFLSLQHRLQKTVVFVTHDIDEAIRMGDRIAILNVGGRLEQFDTPQEILTHPANGFVEDFLGGERGLKRLGLTLVDQAPLQQGPVVDLRDEADRVKAAMESHGTEWVVVLDGDRLVGWAWGADVTGTVGEAETRPFWVRLGRHSTLREALDAVVRSRAHVAVITDGDRYEGMLGLEQIAENIVS
jgi:osmoprotectant transport system ATP-binding protein